MFPPDNTSHRQATRVVLAAVVASSLLAGAVYGLAAPFSSRPEVRSAATRAALVPRESSRLLAIRVQVARRTVAPDATVGYRVRISRGGVLIRPHGPGRRRRAARVWLSVAKPLPDGVTATLKPRATRSPAARLTLRATIRVRPGSYRVRLKARGRLRPDRRHRMRHAQTVVTLVVARPVQRGLTIRGMADGPLAPGVGAPVDLILTNRHHFAIRVSGLRVTISGVRAPQADPRHPCTAADFTVVQPAGSDGLALPASSTRVLHALGVPRVGWPQILMTNRPVNQDGCKHARLMLRFTGNAIARRP
jgi:hypothetical protein